MPSRPGQQRSGRSSGSPSRPLGTRARNPLRTSWARSFSSNIQAVRGERNTVRYGIDGDAGWTPLAAQRPRDAVDGRLRGAIGAVARGMPEFPPRRRHENDLTAATLFQHLPAARAISQDWVTFASITSRNRAGVMSVILATSFFPKRQPGCRDAFKGTGSLGHDSVTCCFAVRAGLNCQHFGAKLPGKSHRFLPGRQRCLPRPRPSRPLRPEPWRRERQRLQNAPVTIATLPRMSKSD